MRTRHVFFALTLTVLLLAVGVWILGFFRSTLTTKRLAVEQEAPDVKAVLSTDRPFSLLPCLRTRRKTSGAR